MMVDGALGNKVWHILFSWKITITNHSYEAISLQGPSCFFLSITKCTVVICIKTSMGSMIIMFQYL